MINVLTVIKLIRGFVFKSVFGHRPDLCKTLLEITLNTKMEKVEILNAEQDLDLVIDRAGGRLDLYAVDDEGNHYDVEVQAQSNKDEALRARRYQALMDASALKKGAKAKDLRNNIVLFICDFDPFDEGLKRYDFRMMCEQTGVALGDGRSMTFLNVRGEQGDVTPRLDALLNLFAGNAVDNDEFVTEIIHEMEKCVSNPAWMEQYMTLEEELEIAKAAAQEEGWTKGHEKGLEKGLEKGREDMAAENAALVEALRNTGRLDELAGALVDENLRETLLREFHIIE